MTLTTSDLKNLYDLDDYQWLEVTIQLLLNKDFAALDLENLIEELVELGKAKKNAVTSLLEQIIRHYLMYEYWEEASINKRHWQAEIYNFKLQLNRLLSSSLTNYLEENLSNIYLSSRQYVAKKTGLNNLPEVNPYSLTELLAEEHLPKI